MSDPLADVANAQRAVEHSQAQLHRTVDAARDAGLTWAQIGTTLNMTRQAAFKRFGKPKDPTTGATMQPQPTSTVKTITETLFRDIAAGDEAATMAALHPDADLSWDDIIAVWRHCVAEQGELEGFGETRVVAPGEGTPSEASEAWRQDVVMLGLSVGVTTLRQEAGELMGRVAVDSQGRVGGVLVLPVDATEFPF
ncbi:hypothetical protein [Galactobacter sp.]|uniref:hypothetical protein n=1 Tax=Galactobacter sp. TaxID=2676125 RepID=UPI0025BB9810|nr:hypothetical protein [Galactobacter sp.]